MKTSTPKPGFTRCNVTLDLETLRAIDQLQAILRLGGRNASKSEVLRYCTVREAHRLMGASAPTPTDPVIHA